MDEWGYGRTAYTVVTQIGPSPGLERACEYYIIHYIAQVAASTFAVPS